MDSKDKDYRLITLVTDVCPILLRRYFLSLARLDRSPGVPFSTLDKYMTFRKNDVKKLKKLRRDQCDLIYPKADEEKWDVTLLSALLLGLFKGQMKTGGDNYIKIIRENRNNLQHKPGNLVTTDEEFDTIWNDIETAALTLASFADGKTYEDEIRARIDTVKTNNLPRLGDTLRVWHEDIIILLRNENEEIKALSKRNSEILEGTHVARKKPAGGTCKRMKTIDVRVDKLRENYRQTLERELPEDFESQSDECEIRHQLQEKHYVVVTGSENTSYLATVLSAIRSGNYDMERCFEIKTPEDWTNVDPIQTDLVLFCEPFEDESNTEKRLRDTFQSMLDTSKESSNESRIDVVIVSEQSKVKSWQEHDDNALFDNVVELFRPTDETNPLNLERRQKSDTRHGTDHVLGNMLAHTEMLIEDCKTDKVNENVMKRLKKKFRTHKSVVITGPRGGKSTRFALKLVSSLYSKNQCVVLTEASDWKQVSLGEVSVIIIDEFAGKYKYNTSFVEAWLNKFDIIYAAVVTGKLNVIVTCQSSFFTKVLKNFAGHDLLNHRVNIPGTDVENVSIKEEPLSPAAENPPSPSNIDDSPHEPKETIRSTDKGGVANSKPCCGDFVGLEKQGGHYQDFCEMHDGTIVCTYAIHDGSSIVETDAREEPKVPKHKWFLAIFNPETFQTTECKELAIEPLDLSVVQGNMEVIFRDEKDKAEIQSATFVDSVIQLGEIERQYVFKDKYKVAKVYGDRYITCSEVSITIYDLKCHKIKTIREHDGKNLFSKYNYFYSGGREQSDIKKHITDLTLGSHNFFVSSLEKIYIFNIYGIVLKSLEAPSMNTYIYDKEMLITLKEKPKPKQIRVFNTNGTYMFTVYRSNTMTRMFYGKKNKRLFVANFNTWSTCVVKAE